MRSNQVIHVVSCHAEGEVGDVIVGGVAPPPGETVWEQSRWIAADGHLRDLVLNEPRGGVFRHVNLLVPPKHPEADVGWIIMEPEDTPPMSGSNSICVSTVLLETGILPMEEPETRLTLEAPGGLIKAVATCKDHDSVGWRYDRSSTPRRDVETPIANLPRLVVVARAAANFAHHLGVGKKLHGDALNALSLASLAAAALHVEAEAAWVVAAELGLGKLREELPDGSEDTRVRRRVGAWRAADGALVDVDDLVDLVEALAERRKKKDT